MEVCSHSLGLVTEPPTPPVCHSHQEHLDMFEPLRQQRPPSGMACQGLSSLPGQGLAHLKP